MTPGIIVVVCAAAFAIVLLIALALQPGTSKPMQQRLAALDCEAVSGEAEEKETDIRREDPLTRFDWLNGFLHRLNIAPSTRLLLYQADVSTRTETLMLISVCGSLTIGVLVYLRTGSFPAALLLGPSFIPMPLLYLFRRRAQRFAKFEQQLPEGLDMLVSALKVGHSLVTAIGALGNDSAEPLAREFRKLFEEQNFGLDLRSAMVNLATRVPLQDVRIFVAAALIQKESGGNLAEVLEKVAHTTRERFRLKKQIMIHTAQGRLTGWILSALPVVLGVGMYLVNPEGMSVLWTRPAGLHLLYAAVSMMAIGALLIRKIVRIRV